MVTGRPVAKRSQPHTLVSSKMAHAHRWKRSGHPAFLRESPPCRLSALDERLFRRKHPCVGHKPLVEGQPVHPCPIGGSFEPMRSIGKNRRLSSFTRLAGVVGQKLAKWFP